MAQKNSLTINLSSNEVKEITSYCKLNNIDDLDKFVTNCFKQGLHIEMYGLLGDDSQKTGALQEKVVEIEVIREKRVEVPVEVIKEVEKIIEVPVEKIVEKIIEKPVEKIEYVEKEVIKEVFVPKIEYIRDESSNNELLKKIEELQNRPPVVVEVEKIVEVPIEKIVEVEKIVYITDESKQEMLQSTLQKLRKELFEKTEKLKSLESFLNQNKNENKPALYNRGSNINDKLL